MKKPWTDKKLLGHKLSAKKLNVSFSYIVGHHDGEKCLIVGVHCHVERGGLEQHEQRVKKNVRRTQQEVGDHADGLTFAIVRFRGCPEQSVDGVLAESWEKPVPHL